MLSRFLLLLTITVLMSVPARSATSNTDLEREYEQVRKIAMKDPKVRAAYDHANEKLNEKIIAIDPSLKPLVEKKSASVQIGHPVSTPAAHTAPTAKQASPSKAGPTHLVAKGETLSAIAARYKVSVKELQAINGIADEKKLRVGQILKIPVSGHPATKAEKSDAGLWNRVKKSFE